MIETPSIKYLRTPDGVDIAYMALGIGAPLVIAISPFGSHLEAEWENGPWRAQLQQLAEHNQVIRFDHRGAGLSTHGLPEYSVEGFACDLTAVLTEFAAEDLTLIGHTFSTGPAVICATAAERRVSRLVLFVPQADRTSIPSVREEAYRAAARLDSDVGIAARAAMEYGIEDADGFAQYVRFLVTCGATSDRAARRAAVDYDIRDRLGEIDIPTLVVSRRQFEAPWKAEIQRVAAAIPGARLVTIPGRSQATFADGDHFVTAVRQFIHADASAVAGPFRTILFTDVVASTPLLAQLKDARMREVMREHEAVLEAAVREHDGRVVKTIGDAFMAEFAVPSAAVACAIAIQRGIRARFADSDVPIRLRIGINAGEPVEEDGDLHGASVVIAKRLESAAPENGILVSEVVKQAVAGKEFTFVGQGELALKGFDEPLRTWSVEWA